VSVDDRVVIDLFAGPGGWDVGAQALGLHPIGLEIDRWACETRYAAGLATWQQSVPDVTDTQLAAMRGRVDGLIASPPCQDFSAAGKKAGITGDKGELMWEVPRWAKALRPRWIACEQVPPAEAWFRLFAHDLRADGYSTWVGGLWAADYGGLRTRRRVFLLASLDRAVQPPEPTHCEGGAEPSMFTPGLLPWVSMAEALGWTGTLDRRQTGAPVLDCNEVPSPTIVGSSIGKGVWVLRAGNPAGNAPTTRPATEPAPTFAFGHDATNWAWERPATTTIVGSFSPDTVAAPGYRQAGDPPRQDTPGSVKITTTEAAILQGFPPDYPWQGSRTAQFQQIGNAVAPPVAAAVLTAVAL